MKKNNHTNFENKFFEKSGISYSKSKEDVWLKMEQKLEQKTSTKVIKPKFKKRTTYSIAAVFLALLGLTAFLRFYSTTVYCPVGQHASITLPAGSKVTLNAKSQLSYNPYWWKLSRNIKLEGEAYFEVTKGRKFSVNSTKGTTTVLGTKFNIYSRKAGYKVHCISGKVKVSNKNKESVILTKNNFVVLNEKAKLVKSKNAETGKNSISWIKNEFVFTEMELTKIFEELERQYGVEIQGKEKIKGLASINFKRGSSVEEVLEIISLPFGIKYNKVSNDKYVVFK